MALTPPSLDGTAIGLAHGTGTRNFGDVAVTAGQLIAVTAASGQIGLTLAISDDQGIVWDAVSRVPGGSFGTAFIWMGRTVSTGTVRVTLTPSGSSGVDLWTGAFRKFAVGGEGGYSMDAVQNNVSGTLPTLPIRQQLPNSAFLTVLVDWAAVDPGDITPPTDYTGWRTVGPTTDANDPVIFHNAASSTTYSGVYLDAGTQLMATEDPTIATPNGQTWTGITLEIFSPDAPAHRYRSGTAAYGTTAAAPAIPAHLAGDQLAVVVGVKPSTATLSTPAGWTKIVEQIGGTGSVAADTGPTKVAVYVLEAAAAGTTINVTATGGSVTAAKAFVYRKRDAAATWDLAATSGADNATGAAVSVTLAADPGLAAGDLALLAFTIPTDVTTPNQFLAVPTLTGHGATLGGEFNKIEEFDTTTGNDMGGLVGQYHVESGVSNAAATWAATAAGTTTNVAGPAALVRIRAVTDAGATGVSSARGGGNIATIGRKGAAVTSTGRAGPRATSSGAKAASGSSRASSGGRAASTAGKSPVAASAVRAGGLVASLARKAAAAASAVRGGGRVTSIGTSETPPPAASGSSTLSGGGRAVSTGRKGAVAASTARSGGRASSAGRKAALASSLVSAAGRLAALARKAAAAVSRAAGGGRVTTTSGRAVTGPSRVSGGGRVTTIAGANIEPLILAPPITGRIAAAHDGHSGCRAQGAAASSLAQAGRTTGGTIG
jgi:hypothetical protein